MLKTTQAIRKPKPRNYDQINIINLDDELEEFSLDAAPKKSEKPTNHSAATNTSASSTNRSATNTFSSSNRNTVNAYTIDSSLNTKNGTSGTNVDVISRKTNNDPLSNSSKTYIQLNNELMTPKKSTQVTSKDVNGVTNSPNISNGMHNGQISSVKSTHTHHKIQQLQQSSPQSSSRSSATPPMTSSRSGTTPLNQRNPVSSVQISKRYTSTPQNKLNKKGFSHEEEDLYIDDIEDF